MARLSFPCRLAQRVILAVTFCAFALESQTTTAEGKLTVEDVVKLTRDHLAEDVVITKIKKNAKPFDLSSDELLDLKKDGVSDTVIKYLLDPSLPYTPPAPPSSAPTPPKAAEPGKTYPADPHANQVPPGEPGLYFFPARESAPFKIDLKLLLGSSEPKSLMKKGKTVAFLVGTSAKTHFKTSMPTFYLRLAEGKEIEEVVLVNLIEKNGRRELDLGPKQELKAEEIHPRDQLEVGARLFSIKPARLDPGEYLFFFIGSAEPSKGVFGKGYDFCIEAEPPKKAK